MSQSQVSSALAHYPDSDPENVRSIAAEHVIQDLLNGLDDADCRAILDATREDALTAREVAETCDLPLSTAYRKLGLLTDAGLLEERTRIRNSGKHTNEYLCSVAEVVISIGPHGDIELQVAQRESAD